MFIIKSIILHYLYSYTIIKNLKLTNFYMNRVFLSMISMIRKLREYKFKQPETYLYGGHWDHCYIAIVN